MSNELTHDAKIIILETADIGGTNTGATGNWATYQDARDFHHVTLKVELGTWNAGDDLDQCKLQQATSSAGAGVKDLTTSASGGDYDTDTPIDADGDAVFIECPTDKMDVDGGFRYVRAYVAEVGNTGTDNISGVLILHKAKHKRENLAASATTGGQVYVRT